MKLISKLCAFKSLSNAVELKTDLVEMSYHCACCPECAKYRGRVFSISGKDKRFPKLPDYIARNGCVHDGCGCTYSPFIFGISTPSYDKAKNIIRFSNRPFVDDRTEKEKSDYNNFMKEIELERQKQIDKVYYHKLSALFPDIVPKSFGAYRKLRSLNNDKFNDIRIKAHEFGIDLDDFNS